MLAKEIEREGIPVALITALTMLGKQVGANRIVAGTKISHPCGDPGLSEKDDRELRGKIVEKALESVQTDVDSPTIFVPSASFTSG